MIANMTTIDVVYFRSRYQEIILAILDRINCIIEDAVLEDNIFEANSDVPLNINHENPIRKYIARAILESDGDNLHTFLKKYGKAVMSELKDAVEESYYKDPPRVHDCAVDVDIDRARLDTFLEVFDHRGTYLEPDVQILKDWLMFNPTEIGRESWS